MPLAAGSRVGSYEVLAPIGAGGMGEVYRARDTRLNRDVALKVLPDVFSGDGDRRARFEREAQLLATLNHPHIAQIYGLEDSAAGIHALVMELVDGPTLADRIAQGPLPVDEALTIARQIAEALEAAHDRGVIHRDLKPANVKMTADGAVKVLDFGLAKLIEPAAGSGAAGATAQSPLTLSPTLSVQATYAGVLLGTAAYMSPEQARGRTVDHRADVWAFGCVVYEMLTAVRPFAGDDLAETIGAVIHKAVDWSRLPANTPPAVRMTLERCLEKDPKRRLRDIGDVRLALSGAFETPAAPVVVAPSRRSRLPLLAGVGVALAIGAVAAGAAVWALTRPTPPQVSRFTITPAAGQSVAETNTDRQLAISSDGRRIVYVSGPGGLGGVLVVRQLDRLGTELVPGVTLARNPFFSPDGQSIGYFTGPNGELRRVSVNGGPSSAVSRIQGTVRGASWAEDGTIVFATNDLSTGLLSVPAGGGEPKVLTKPDATKGEIDHFFPSVLPGGKAVLFTINSGSRDQSRVAVLELATGRRKELIPSGSDPVYLETGHLLYATAGTLRAVRFDVGRLEVIGDAVPVIDRLATANTGAAQYAVSRNGTLVHLEGTLASGAVRRSLVWVDRRSGRQQPLTEEVRAYTYPRLSPDESRLAINILDQDLDVWVWDMRRRSWQRITDDPAVDFSPVWTHDGSTLIFSSPRGGVPNLYKRSSDGTGRDERVTTSTNVQWPTGLTPDGKTVIVHEQVGASVDLTALPLDTATNAKGQTRPLIQSTFFDEGGEISPNGQFIAYFSNRSGTEEVYVQPYPAVDRLWKVSTAGGSRPTWSKDGRELFYLDVNTAMMAVPVQTKPTFSAGIPTKLFDGPWFIGQSHTYEVSNDGQRFLMLKESTPSPATASAIDINVVLHWTEELKQLLPR